MAEFRNNMIMTSPPLVYKRHLEAYAIRELLLSCGFSHENITIWCREYQNVEARGPLRNAFYLSVRRRQDSRGTSFLLEEFHEITGSALSEEHIAFQNKIDQEWLEFCQLVDMGAIQAPRFSAATRRAYVRQLIKCGLSNNHNFKLIHPMPIDIPAPYIDAYAVQQFLVSVGFSSDDIFVGCISMIMHGRTVQNMLTVSLRTAGQEVFFAVGNMGDDAIKNEVNARWQQFATDIVDGVYSEEVLKEVVDQSPVVGTDRHKFLLLQVIQEKGIPLPHRQKGI